MKKRKEHLQLTTDGDGWYETMRPVRWWDKLTDLVIKVPSGFKTDLASVPALLWPLIPPWGEHARAAVIHDYLYSTRGLYVLTRRQCDRIFRDVMYMSGVWLVRRWVMWLGVRLGGGHAWRSHTRRQR